MKDKEFSNLPYDAIVKALFENYECIYDIDTETNSYRLYYESSAYQDFQLKKSGSDFFESLNVTVPVLIHPEDQELVLSMLSKKKLMEGLAKEKYYSLIYRVIVNGSPLYHKIRAIRCSIGGTDHILLATRNIDEAIRRDIYHHTVVNDLHKKGDTYLEAILASSIGYMEVDLTADRILKMSPLYTSKGILTSNQRGGDILRYSETKKRISSLIIKGREEYERISAPAYLINCFSRNEKRASVEFEIETETGDSAICREVYYLYRDERDKHTHSFNVLYDLTEQQKKEIEMKRLEEELRMSRIHNFTSQMQPHFLYNALGSIQEVILEDPEYASELVGDFTTHLRSCIRAMSHDAPLPFEKELENIRAYVNIEKMRFGRKLKVKYEIQTDEFDIIPLSIQPLVENAIRHGIYQKGKEGGTVWIRTSENQNVFIVEVEDNGVGFDVKKKPDNESHGLQNVRFRLKHMMNGMLHITSEPGRGTKAVVCLPKNGVNNENNHT